jgi:hypothetical protein
MNTHKSGAHPQFFTGEAGTAAIYDLSLIQKLRFTNHVASVTVTKPCLQLHLYKYIYKNCMFHDSFT